MNIPQIMSAMTVIRKEITEQHADLAHYKKFRTIYSNMGKQEDATQFHKYVVKVRAAIKRLVSLQVALKADYKYKLSLQRAENLVLNGWLKPHLDAAKRDTEAKGQAAKEAAMLWSGEMY